MTERRSLDCQPSPPRLTTSARPRRRPPTPAEHLFWEHVRGQRVQGLYFQRQSIVGGYLTDFYCSELRLAVELDGPAHDQPGASGRQRDRTMRWLGVRVVRVTSQEVFDSLESLVDRLVREARPDRQGPARRQGPEVPWAASRGTERAPAVPTPAPRWPADGREVPVDIGPTTDAPSRPPLTPRG